VRSAADGATNGTQRQKLLRTREFQRAHSLLLSDPIQARLRELHFRIALVDFAKWQCFPLAQVPGTCRLAFHKRAVNVPLGNQR